MKKIFIYYKIIDIYNESKNLYLYFNKSHNLLNILNIQ